VRIYAFGPFVLDVDRFELVKNGATIALPKIPMEVLIVLVERAGGLVSRQELAERLWSNSDPEAVKQSINNAVNRIRYTLLDNVEEPLYIQTVVGKGYRFVSAIEASSEPALDPPIQAASMRTQSVETSVTESPVEGSALPQSGSDPEPEEGSRFLSRTRWRTGLLAFAVLLAAGGLGVAKYRWRSRPGDRQAGTFQLTRLTSNSTKDWVTASALSPDGATVVFAEPTRLRLYSIRGVEASSIATPDLRVIDRIAWFSDNYQFLVSGLNRASGVPEVWLYSSAASLPIKMRSDARMAVPSPSGSQIAFTNASGAEIWVMDTLGQRPRRLLESSPGTTYEALTWTSGGKTLVAERLQRDARFAAPSWDPTHGIKTSYLATDVSSGKERAVHDDVWMEDAALLPTGELLYTQPDEKGLALWSVLIDSESGAFLAPPRFLQQVPQLRHLTAAKNGLVAALSIDIRPQIAVGDLQEHPIRLEAVHSIATEGSRAYPHAWSADSTSLYFEQQLSDRWRISSTSLASAQSGGLVSTPLDQTNPRLTPDHRWILFEGREPGMRPTQLFRMPVKGGTPQLVHTNGPVSDFRCPLRAGQCMLRELDDLKRLVFVPIDPIDGAGSPILTLAWDASNNLGDWNISADGKRLALIPPRSSDSLLQVIEIATGHIEQVPIDVHRPIEAVSWAADGKGWYLALANGHGSDLVYIEPKRPPILLRQTTGRTYAVPSPDGRKLAFVDQNIDSNVWLLRPSGRYVKP
jgi:DNA-binding winged helix-turn-helix (wHTH) protein/Tol biopolymer transport system component